MLLLSSYQRNFKAHKSESSFTSELWDLYGDFNLLFAIVRLKILLTLLDLGKSEPINVPTLSICRNQQVLCWKNIPEAYENRGKCVRMAKCFPMQKNENSRRVQEKRKENVHRGGGGWWCWKSSTWSTTSTARAVHASIIWNIEIGERRKNRMS